MISISMTRLGTPGCAAAAYAGTGAQAAFGPGADMRWFKQREHLALLTAVRVVDLIPVSGSAIGTRLSAPPERSP